MSEPAVSVPPRRGSRLAAFVFPDGVDPRGVHTPLTRAGLPGWAWRALTWAFIAGDLLVLARSPWGYLGFFIAFPLLWLVHVRYGVAVVALVVFGVGIAAADYVRGDELWWAVAPVAVALSLVTGTWMTWAQVARAEAVKALAERELAMEALALAQGELAAAEHAAGAAAERERWEREVHDTLAQGFVSVITLSQTAQAELDDAAPLRPCALAARLSQIEDVARDNLIEARALVAGQGPSALHEERLDAALQRLVSIQARHGIRATLTADLPEDLAPAYQVVVLRLVQESLSNVARHARAERAEVTVAPDGPHLVVTVSDDGVGVGGAPEGGGLTGMRSRVEDLGGELSVLALHAPDERGRTGTVIRATMPL